MNPRARIEYRTQALLDAGLWRDPRDGLGPEAEAVIDTRSNDYLGLAAEGVSRETPGGELLRLGAGASRVVSGTWEEHLELENALAAWLGAEACLLFSSGYAANVGVVSALAGPGETILSDALNHASIIDGCRLSRANVVVLPHAQPEALERALADTHGVRWVVTESYFGMDGDSPNLPALRALCDRHGAALVVDEAHAIGVFGPEGRGLCAAARVVPDVLIGGLGKAFGSQGGFAACDRVFRDWLWNRARSLVFSTAPSPILSRLTLQKLDRVRAAESERSRLQVLESSLDGALRAAGVPLPAHRHGPVFPVILGSEGAVIDAAARMRALGVRCQPIRPPTVPRGASRLRVILRADMTEAQVEAIGAGLVAIWQQIAPTANGAPRAPGEALGEHPIEEPAGSVPGGKPGSLASAARVAEAPAPPLALALATPMAGAAPRGARAIGDQEPGGPGSTERGERPALTATSSSASGARGSDAGSGAAVPARWVVLGTGTGIGKTFVARALVELLAHQGRPVAGLKPIETGISRGAPAPHSDAAALAAVSFHVKLPAPHPLYALPDPVTPSLAARRAGATVRLQGLPEWANQARALDGHSPTLVVESAGGVFSPISDSSTNLDLAQAFGPAHWILVAPDRLGVLHDIQSCLQAMRSLARWPDWIVLSSPEVPDASTGTNAAELRRRPAPPIITLPRHDPSALADLLSVSPHAAPDPS